MTAVELPEDEEFLNTRPWWIGACMRCQHQDVPTTEVGVIERASRPAFGVMFCRACVRVLLAQERAAAAEQGRPYVPAFPGELRRPVELPGLRRRPG